VRDIILRLRDRGTTVFFSSHILADAETLCSRVAIVAQGRLVASGSLAEMVPFRIRGWDLVVAGLTPEALAEFAAGGTATRQIADGRHHLVLPEGAPVEAALGRLASLGAQLISVNPVRDTLEDFFMSRVRETGGRKVG